MRLPPLPDWLVEQRRAAVPVEPDTSKLSAVQRHILASLYKPYLGMDSDTATADGAFTRFGRPWRTKGTRSDQAVMSRSLARLERRGLLLRQNEMSGMPGAGCCREHRDEPHGRTTHVRLNIAGLEAAKRLTKDAA